MAEAFSETGPENSSSINAYTNVGTPGSQQVNMGSSISTGGSSLTDQQGWTPQPFVGSPPSSFSSSGGSPSGNIKPAATAYSPGASNPNATYEGPSTEPSTEKSEEKPNSKLPGQGGTPPMKVMGPEWMNNTQGDNAVTPTRSMPSAQMPVAGSGVKKAFFEAQADTLKAMLPYWKG